MLRILLPAGWHVGRRLKGRSRFEEQVAVLAKITSQARAGAVNLVVVAGGCSTR